MLLNRLSSYYRGRARAPRPAGGHEDGNWLMTDDAFLRALEQEPALQAAMLNGDPDPMISYWADREDITVFGGWGRIEKGHKPVTDAMRWVGSRFTGTDAVDLEHLVIGSSGDLAYTVGFERSHVSVDGGPPGDMTLRVTHIYRRIDGDWKLIHRHADFPPPDPRTTSAR
jgi:ketosteroid isomerase-like protein